jgi:prepilin peptidase CpaA
VIDLRTRRVPNALTAAWAAVGLGLAATGVGRLGLGAALLGLGLGVACMLPGHLFGATGAGDVKLLGAAGALLGPAGILKAFLFTALAGGVLAVIVALRRRRLQQTVQATADLAARRGSGIEATPDNRFAYAPAIAIGVTAVALGW